ncbi:alpha-L-arabinofuranosidase [Neolewinella xylanilytica]|uniref:non-reducing end alpha-L-arabinofuranosidase n=1 Tax=Neolewinella xylanilytica TaxID=1514080 RepID=A0A2S6I1M4_9BACT|nr:alpha-L-arabinofuranosidase C-terminal domain-containing protein [Neolewinella xylanilytica]PPK85043.1 alpha-L-arabinofuranosidase [Neolewinella xylanilytica]
MHNRIRLLALLLGIACSPLTAQVELTVHVDQPQFEISPTMYGIFFEDINFAADGGIYAELVKNRSFEFDRPLMGWQREDRAGGAGATLVENEQAIRPDNPRYLTVTVDATDGAYVLRNEGFRGMGIKAEETYDFSVLARNATGDLNLAIALTDTSGQVIGRSEVPLDAAGADYSAVTASLTADRTDARARLELIFTGRGTVELDMISLFPRHTWKDRPGGLRKDLVSLLDSLEPGFVRFPGGCIVEGRDLANRYQWKKTVGDVEDRKLIVNRWNTEFNYPRNAPDYYQSYGLGFYEYFLLSEDLGAEPLPILNCGMACQFNTGEVVAMDELDPYIQDALDLIEFANGDATTRWGKLRAEMGHPEPFGMEYLGVGNEQWGPEYVERYQAFTDVLRAEHPEITLVTTVGPFPDGDRFDYLWGELNKLDPQVVDEHYYRPPEWFLANAGRYDDYDRNGPAIFAGEYAAHGPSDDRPESRNNWLSALTEAAFMTGLERNGDVVRLTSYAPLMAHLDAWQWRPDLIWFDNLDVGPTPNYHVQRLFSNNAGTHGIPALANGAPLTGQDSLYASAVLDTIAGTVIVKMVNAGGQPAPLSVRLPGKTATTKANLTVLRSNGIMDYNTVGTPSIRPKTEQINPVGQGTKLTLPPQSVTVLTVTLE